MVAVMMQSALRASSIVSARPAARRSLVVRASSNEQPTKDMSGTYFFKGKSYSAEEWDKAVADGSVNVAAPTPSFASNDEYAAGGQAMGLSDLMAFAGPAPELINGRLAMLAVVAAIGAELSSGESVLRQLADEPTGILLTAVIFIAASLIPLMSTTKREAFGPFSPAAEMLNGRAAMLGFASLLAVEAVRGGSALF